MPSKHSFSLTSADKTLLKIRNGRRQCVDGSREGSDAALSRGM